MQTRLLSWLIIFFIYINFQPIYSLEINIQDTIIYQGENNKAKIPIIGTIHNQSIQSIKLIIIYNAYGLSINNVIGKNNFMMRSEKPLFINNLENLDSAKLEIYDNNVQSLVNDTICILEIEGLVSFDSLAYLKIDKVFINDIEQNELTPKIAKIKIIGTVIQPNFEEGLGYNYPNPFFSDTRIPFFVNNTTKIRFIFFSSSGEIIQDSWDDENSVELIYFDKNGQILAVTPNYLFRRGEYTLYINPLSWRFASGIYTLVMKTDFGVYYQHLVNVK